jgi:hypothetical protein
MCLHVSATKFVNKSLNAAMVMCDELEMKPT